jgi:hypothetical protein
MTTILLHNKSVVKGRPVERTERSGRSEARTSDPSRRSNETGSRVMANRRGSGPGPSGPSRDRQADGQKSHVATHAGLARPGSGADLEQWIGSVLSLLCAAKTRGRSPARVGRGGPSLPHWMAGAASATSAAWSSRARDCLRGWPSVTSPKVNAEAHAGGGVAIGRHLSGARRHGLAVPFVSPRSTVGYSDNLETRRSVRGISGSPRRCGVATMGGLHPEERENRIIHSVRSTCLAAP